MKVTENCYAVLGLACYPPWTVNSGFIVGKDTTLIVDSGFNSLAASTIYGYASCVREKNKYILLNTEKHLDHIGGNSFFHKMIIDIFGHKDISRTDEELQENIRYYNDSILDEQRKELEECNLIFRDTYIVNPNKPISSNIELNLGGLDVHVFLTPGHTKTNISVFVPKDKVIYCGDCIVNGYLPNMESGNAEDLKTWLNSLDLILSKDPEYVVPGHGFVLKGSEIENEVARIKSILNESMRSV